MKNITRHGHTFPLSLLNNNYVADAVYRANRAVKDFGADSSTAQRYIALIKVNVDEQQSKVAIELRTSTV